MKFECPECGNSIEVDDESAAKVLCQHCSALVTAPPSMAITDTPQSRPKYAEEDEPPRRDRPPSQPSSRGRNIAVVIGILIVIGVPLLLLLSCVGLSALVTLVTHDDRQVAVAPAPMVVQMQADQAIADELPIGAQPPEFDVPGPPPPEPPVLVDVGRLNEFIAENLTANPQNGALAPDAPVWKKIAAANKEQLIASPLIKGNWGVVDFRETAPDNGILVGFFVSAPNDFLVNYVQPIYLTPKGEKVGKAYGVANQRVVCVKAKDGYAVGAVDVRSGDLFDSLAVRFMRVRDDSLDARDSYSSVRVGGNGGDPLRVGGEGALIVGIHGRALNQANITPAGSITTLGVLTLR
jgi:hypothetical protein